MEFKKGLVSLSLLILFVMPMFLALDTPIQIKTQPNYAVTIRALDIDGKGTLEGGAFLDQIADANGIVKVTFSSDTENKIDISLMIKTAVGGTMVQFAGGPVQVLKNNGDHIKTGWPVEIDTTANPPILVKSGKPAGAVEESIINSTDTKELVKETKVTYSPEDSSITEENNELGVRTTGKSIGVGKSILTSKITYFILGLLIIFFVVGIIAKKKIINFSPHEPKKSEFKVLARENPKLKDAERKLDQAKKELDEIRNKNSSLQEARKRLEADRRELERLERD